MADTLAKKGLENDTTQETGLGLTEIYAKIKKATKQQWQEQWDKNKGKLYHTLFPKIGAKQHLDFNNNDKNINKIRLGATIYNHKNQACPYCNIKLSSKHILMKCIAVEPFRKNIQEECSRTGREHTLESILDIRAPQSIQAIVRKTLRVFQNMI